MINNRRAIQITSSVFPILLSFFLLANGFSHSSVSRFEDLLPQQFICYEMLKQNTNTRKILLRSRTQNHAQKKMLKPFYKHGIAPPSIKLFGFILHTPNTFFHPELNETFVNVTNLNRNTKIR